MKYTFGKTRACEKLEALLEGNSNASRRISSMLSKYTNKLYHVTGAKDPATVVTCMVLLRNQALKQIDNMKIADDNIDIKAQARGVVSERYRNYHNAFQSLLPAIEFLMEKERQQRNNKEN